jgi:putative ABC transport system ATP-binding protein
MALLQSLNREGITIVVVTHENDVAAFASRTILFRDGRVVSDVRHAPRVAHAPDAVTASAPPPAPANAAWQRPR